MKRNRRSTPLGTKDLLLEDCLVRRDVEAKLSDLFVQRGFSEVMTPGMEFLDVFAGEKPAIPAESMYKMTDAKGRLLVMRPDSTMPIARLVATRLQRATLPVRLYYAQDVFHMNVGLTGHADQEFQAGIELIGASGKRADLEVITLAAAALEAVVGKDFRLEIGHVGFFQSLMKELGTDADTTEEIRDLIEEKNYASLGDLLDRLPSGDAVEAVRRLPRLFGGEEVLSEAQMLCRTEDGREALDYLASLYESLRTLGLEKQVMLDLGMLHRNEYYTGVIFRGYIEGSGDLALSGGRYDTLLSEFGSPLAATGFAINVDCVTRVLHARGEVQPPIACEVLVHAEDGYETKALQKVAELVEDGTLCEFSVFDTTEDSYAYARERGIPQVITVGETEQTYEID